VNEPSWRVGREVGRTLYLNETLVGLMDTPDLAAAVVAVMNAQVADAPAAAQALRDAADAYDGPGGLSVRAWLYRRADELDPS
jgi:hypothetical protein